MLSKPFLFVLLLFLPLKSYVTYSPEDDDEQTDIRRTMRNSGLFDAFNNFFNNVKNFFGRKTRLLEEKRLRVKSAFELFFQELNKKKATVKPGPAENEELIPLYPLPKLKTNLDSESQKAGYDIKPENTAEQMITAHGYTTESHTVLTADGYMITMQRVLPDANRHNNRVVMIHHGLYGSAEDWLLLGKERALPYLLTESGFDVWLLNARGNRYSRIHMNRNVERLEFWDFSWHEIGVYDLPAVIRYISEITKNAELNFIGHSMGATALLALLTTAPEYNLILRSGILLAPLVFMYHAKGPIRALTDFYSRNGHASLQFLGQTQFMVNGDFPDQIVDKYCKGDQLTCSNPLLLLACGGKESIGRNLIEDILTHVPAGGSVKTIIHYVQLVKSGYFQMFDYGAGVNMIKYGNNTPPLYNLDLVTLPLALFTSPSDWLSTVSDIHTLLPILQNVHVHHVLKADEFSHLDFLWSSDAPELVYDFILPILDKILPRHDSFFGDK